MCDSDELSLDLSEERVTALVIGDPHFKASRQKEGREFVEKMIEKAVELTPEFIVILGDSLDTHETAKQGPFDLLHDLLSVLVNIAHTYLIVGNHDYINQSQFLSDKHFFNPYKKWENLTVVDRPIYREINAHAFVFCPYVQPGKFVEALNVLVEEGQMWDLADCIFAHQEFAGCKMGAKISTAGDGWDESYPPVISGHIHDAQTLNDQIFYTGSSIQHAFGESTKKRVWFVEFGSDEPPFFSVEKHDLGMKAKKMMYLTVKEVEDFNVKQLDKYEIKMSLKGTSEEFKVFRRSKTYEQLAKLGVKFAYQKVDDVTSDKIGKRTREHVSFLNVLSKVVKEKSDPVQKMYKMVIEDAISSPVDEVDIPQRSKSQEESITDTDITSSEEAELVFESDTDED